MVKRIQANSTSYQTCDVETLADYGLDSVDCPECNNRGYIVYQKDGVTYSRECKCMEQRRYNRRINKSGMDDMMKRYTFDSYQAADAYRKGLKERAMQFCNADKGWWYISGRAGSGKTHICVAMCNQFAKQGKEVRYMLWRDEATVLKGMVNDPEYHTRMDKLKSVPVLYIDDFFKTGKQAVTTADINLAFELINGRYNNADLRTIISSELSVKDIIELDEATGSRIWERSMKIRAPQENWRLK